MQLKELMTSNPEVVHPDDVVQEAAVKMNQLNVGALPVTEGNRLVGILTDRDITVRVTALGLDPATARVRDAMTSDPVYGTENMDVKDAAQLMGEHQIRRLPVVSGDRRLVGIVALGDLAVETHNDKLSGETLEAISEPAKPGR